MLDPLLRYKCRSLLSLWLVLSFIYGTASAASPVHLDRHGEKWASETLRAMSLEEKIGQLIMPWARIEFMNVNNPDYALLRDEMDKYHVGGFGVTVFVDGPSLLKSEPLEGAALTNELQKHSKYPLMFAADFERGLSVRMNGATSFPSAMAFGAAGDKQLVREFGIITAHEARAVGIHWNWFPVADVNSNPANPIINTRSFGEDPTVVGDMVAAYIDGARSEGMLTTVKHFPGHGDTDTDSHLALARSSASLERLNALELVPFRKAIAAGVDSVMMAHMTVPAIESDPNLPASVSYKVVTGLLREKLGFQGIVVTDALDMGALTHAFTGTIAEISGKEAVAAILAGNDMVIIPADLDGAYNGLLNAVKQGTITQDRLDESVLKLLRMKASVGLDRSRYVDLANVETEIAKPENVTVGQEVADRAVTLVTDKYRLVPIHAPQSQAAHEPKDSVKSEAMPPSGIVAVIFTDDARTSEGGRMFARTLRQEVPDASVYFVDEANSTFIAGDVLAATDKARIVLALAEAVPIARRATAEDAKGSAALSQSAADLLASIVKTSGQKTIVTAFGNPYTGSAIPDVGTYLCTFSNTPGSALSLVHALFGAIPIHGRLPVTIPGIAQRGAGLDR